MSENSADENSADENSADKEKSAKQPTFAELAGQYAANSGITRNEHGQIDIMKAVGGWRGLAETLLPGLVFLVCIIVSGNLTVSLISSIAVAVIFTVVRLVQRGVVIQAFSGLAGIAICALFSGSTGNALDYYVPGFLTNAISIAVILISIVARWPITGLIFGFIRGENLEWRAKADRLRAYQLAAWIVLGLFVLRLLVQVPLYFAQNLPALGATRLAMGVPLYALALWLAWMVSRPAATVAADPEHSADVSPEAP